MKLAAKFKQEVGEAGFSYLYGTELVKFIEEVGYPWFRVGVVVRNAEGKYLCVKERPGWKKVSGRWNLPGGQVDADEDIFKAAVREVYEETGCKIRLIGVCQIGQRLDRNNPYIMVTFVGTLVDSTENFDPTETERAGWLSRLVSAFSCGFWPTETERAGWLSREEIEELDQAGEIRNHDFMVKSIRNYASGIIAPLGIVDIYKRR